MPNPVIPIAGAIVGVGAVTIVEQGVLMAPKAMALFYVQIAKDCYVATGSKRIACGAAAVACGVALVPGPHQSPFIVACADASRGANRL